MVFEIVKGYRDWKWEMSYSRMLAGMAQNGLLLKVRTKHLVESQYVAGRCSRLDLYVRLLALEELDGKSASGVDLYNKLIRNKGQRISHTISGFEKLLRSIRKNGIYSECPVEITPKFVLRQGMHRLACAVYLEIAELPVTVFRAKFLMPDYSVERLQSIGFTATEIEQVLDAEHRYLGPMK